MVVRFDGGSLEYVAGDEATHVWVLRGDVSQGDFAGAVILVVCVVLGDAGRVGLVQRGGHERADDDRYCDHRAARVGIAASGCGVGVR